jgi:peptidoglycan/xylan/chitin deacetylase (PgdA/CDA1 family)
MRATFFVPTRFISERRLYWWERIAYVLSQGRRPAATVMYPQPIEIVREDRAAHNKLTDIIKNTPGLDIDRFLDELCEAFGIEWNREIEAQHADGLVMTWDHLRALTRAGMDVESHTRGHRVLQTLDDDALRDELAGSKAELESQLGRPIRAIAYPVGRRIARLQKIRSAVEAAGYQVGLSNASGATRIWPAPMSGMWPTDRFDVCRLSTDKALSDALYLAQVAVPRLAYISRHND